ncbi:MAG: hypothetical protein H0T71_00260 [Acidobacteria bacterium]|nr:hypothetical protein [Acidobacteriota bacterium]
MHAEEMGDAQIAVSWGSDLRTGLMLPPDLANASYLPDPWLGSHRDDASFQALGDRDAAAAFEASAGALMRNAVKAG